MKSLEILTVAVMFFAAIYFAILIAMSPAPMWLIIPVNIFLGGLALFSLDGLLCLIGTPEKNKRR